MEHVHARPRGMRRALVAAASLTCATLALYPGIRAHAATPALSVQYKTGTAASAYEAEPWLELTNTSTTPIALSAVTVRYYFSADNAASYTFACAWAVVSCSNVTGTVVALANPTATADHYLQLSFASGAGTLAPGANTGDLQLRLYRSDWQNVNQANDYSFNGADTAYAPNPAITAYDNGTLVWGTEPAGTGGPTPTPTPSGSGTGTPTPTPTGTTTPPSGAALFDDFDYSGPADAGIGAHGWKIRTGAGGPGVQNSWTADTFSFPSDPTAKGGKVMQMTASTDGTTGGTKQAEIDTTAQKFFEGTYAARVYFNDAPTTGQNGDHVNETFYTITPDDSLYSELDNEYLPNGGWGAPGPTLYTTSWYSSDAFDRVTHNVISSLQGWHTLVMNVTGGVVTYYVDGQQYFSSTGKYYPREKMTIDFNEWFIDLPFTGARTWNQKVNWVYYNTSALSPTAVDSAVNGYYSSGTHFTDTVPQ